MTDSGLVFWGCTRVCDKVPYLMKFHVGQCVGASCECATMLCVKDLCVARDLKPARHGNRWSQHGTWQNMKRHDT